MKRAGTLEVRLEVEGARVVDGVVVAQVAEFRIAGGKRRRARKKKSTPKKEP